MISGTVRPEVRLQQIEFMRSPALWPFRWRLLVYRYDQQSHSLESGQLRPCQLGLFVEAVVYKAQVGRGVVLGGSTVIGRFDSMEQLFDAGWRCAVKL